MELFNRPSPDVAIVQENVCFFRVAVERHLKSRSRLSVRLFFRGDVFRFLLTGKGLTREGWTILRKKISMLFIFVLGGIPRWTLMVKE